MKVYLVDEQDDPLEHHAIEPVALAAMTAEGLAERTELAITLIDEPTMAGLNNEHMGVTGPTDVLSFPLENLAPGIVPVPREDGPPLVLGDIFICPAVVSRNASRSDVPFEDEMALMVVHGVLHLLGYDHAVDAEAEHMEQRERDVLASVGRVRP